MRRIIGLSLCIFLIAGSVLAGTSRRGKVVFWSYDTDNFPIMWVYIMNADGSGVTKLPLGREFQAEAQKNLSADYYLSLAPDCQKIAFRLETWNGNVLASLDIAIFDLDSGEIVNLTNDELGACGWPRWSPDGKQIVCSGAGAKLYVMNSDGTKIRMIGEGELPDWSPDRRRIAFTRDGMDIYTMDADGGDVRRIAASPTWRIRMLRWSPDGKAILFTTYANNDIGRIYIMDLNGGNLKLIRENSSYACWSPDGKKIAFGHTDNEANVWHGHHIWLMNSDGGGLERLTDNERGEMYFDWRDPAFLEVNPLPKPAKTAWGWIKTQIK